MLYLGTISLKIISSAIFLSISFFIITGSNSSLLTSDFATVLTGRVLKLSVHSFSFKEFLKFKNISYGTRIEQISNKIEIYPYPFLG